MGSGLPHELLRPPYHSTTKTAYVPHTYCRKYFIAGLDSHLCEHPVQQD